MELEFENRIDDYLGYMKVKRRRDSTFLIILLGVPILLLLLLFSTIIIIREIRYNHCLLIIGTIVVWFILFPIKMKYNDYKILKNNIFSNNEYIKSKIIINEDLIKYECNNIIKKYSKLDIKSVIEGQKNVYIEFYSGGVIIIPSKYIQLDRNTNIVNILSRVK